MVEKSRAETERDVGKPKKPALRVQQSAQRFVNLFENAAKLTLRKDQNVVRFEIIKIACF